MIKDFETFISEGRMGRLIDASRNEVIRKEDGKTYHPAYMPEGFSVVISNTTTPENFERFMKRLYEGLIAYSALSVAYETDEDYSHFTVPAPIGNRTARYFSYKNFKDPQDIETSYDVIWGGADIDKVINETDYYAAIEIYKHLLEGIRYDDRNRSMDDPGAEAAIIIEEDRMWNIVSEIQDEDYVAQFYEAMLNDFMNVVEGIDLNNQLKISRSELKMKSFSNYADEIHIKICDFGNLICAYHISQYLEKHYNEIQKDPYGYYGLGDE